DVATRFTSLLVPSESRLVRNSTRTSAQWRNTGQALRFEWIREFYRIRGDFAHGQLQTRQDMVWGFGEHLVLATIAFPLLVKILLKKDNKYTLTEGDLSQIEGFEAFGDPPRFTYPPDDATGSLDSHWKRVRRETRRATVIKQVLEELKRATEKDLAAEPD